MAPFLPSLFGEGLPQYKYTPIPQGTRTFRLAKLLPPEPSLIPGFEPTLRISIFECEAGDDKAPASLEYDALSYAWDVPPHVKRPNRRVLVEDGDGKRAYLLIYRPLELALLQFAAANARNEEQKYELPIFVDQICINQEDDDEKAHQVSLMQAIYAHSHRTIVWLGPGTASSKAWFVYVRALCADGVLGRLMGPRVASIMRIYDAIAHPGSVALTDPVEIQDHDELLALTERVALRYPIAAYLALLQRTWFGRLWTIQEVCLPRDVLMVCGDQSLCFFCFRVGMFFYNVQNSYWLRQNTAPVSRQELWMRNAVFEATEGPRRIHTERRAIHGTVGPAPLHEITIKHSLVNEAGWKVGASLAQDRIYGLLGLTAPTDPARNRLGIYYNNENQEAAQVKAYTEAMLLFLEQGRADMLLFNQFPKTTAGLPSWVPDWAMKLALPVAWTALHEPAFAAGGSQAVSPAKVDASTGRVTLTGVLIGRVAAIGRATYDTHDGPNLKQIKYDSAKLVFDEVDDFVRSTLSHSSSATATSPSPETVSHMSLRVYDSGLSACHFAAQCGSSDTGMQRLLELQSSIFALGARLLRSAAFARSYSLRHIYATIGITPWYVDYYHATTILHGLARGPVPLARTVVLAIADLVADVVGVCAASARVRLATTWIALRARFARPRLHVPEAEMRSVGLDPDTVTGADMGAFLENLHRNVGRRVFRTDGGAAPRVGMGPGTMRAGDAVVVLNGLTVPIILRPVDGGKGEWTVVGEAYCDGVMNGEALGVNEREFVLV
ncbi:Heterokaryon incompatibility [Cordyceps fumosorosea ARSEF 2679]|uniref:Heterokaryon incompatibility n=1 Tax=Cordyceps fumosorosea (strain ARSEF 2679) TaxID=1081104 RepID=A0A162LP31_CORFA|nr:Heterokaryon incompatibility [Cordyceps fumosorosea ARSEF 2679]OAA73574.1 Heterokaryon incompatibility [Cordyceps fumosorosea ARSEF 2679]